MQKWALALALPLLVSHAAHAQWEVVEPNLGTIIMGVDFTDPATGYLAGANNGVGPVIWKSTDGGDTYDILHDEPLTMSHMDIAMGHGDFGITSGMGAFYAFAGATKTTDGGRNWSRSGGLWLFGVSQDADSVGNSHAMMAGAWGDFTTEWNGLAITTDQGRKWEFSNWGAPSYARYVDFVDEDTGFLSGGHWPSDSSRSISGAKGRQITSHFAVPHSFAPKRANPQYAEGYYGAVTKTTDGGKSWVTIFETNEAYLNGIFFTDANTGWVVGDGAEDGIIFHTNDGGVTWSEQWRGEASLLQVKMASDQRGFAIGADLSARRPTTLILETHNGGQDWTPMEIDGDFYLLNLDVVDENNAWAVGLNMATNLCGVLRYRSN